MPKPRSTTKPSPLLGPLLLIVCGTGAYFNSLSGAFVFDDLTTIVTNPHLDHLWPPWKAGDSSLRLLLFYTLALNRALGGQAPWSYHLVNLGLHLAASLVLYGLVRRCLALVPAYAPKAGALALATALIWCVHPLQTQSVTYIIQRGESMASLFYLLTLYGVLRGAQAQTPSGFSGWYAVAAAAYYSGLASKEIAVTIPVAVLLFDVALLSGSYREAWRRRRYLYLTLLAPQATVALWWALTNPGNFSLLLGDSEKTSALHYAISQPGVVLYYLRLALWPWPQAIDYAWPAVSSWEGAVIPGAVVGSAVIAVGWGLWRHCLWALPAALFFLVLAPTSSLVPLQDILVEHRMYLPLASVVLLLVLGIDRWLRPGRGTATVLVLLATIVLGALTIKRNSIYRDGLTLWNDAAQHRPHNARAFNNIGFYLVQKRRFSAALVQYQKSLDLDPDYAEAHANMGAAHAALGHIDQAISSYVRAIELKGESAETRLNLGLALAGQGRLDEAIEQYKQALELNPNYAETHANMGVALVAAGQVTAAQEYFVQALRLNPNLPEAHNNLASIMVGQGRLQEALPHYRQAIASRAQYLDAHINLGIALLWLKRHTEAETKFRHALKLSPTSPKASFYLGEAIAGQGRLPEAVDYYRRAIKRVARYPEALAGLGQALLDLGERQEGIAKLRQALELKPELSRAQRSLKNALGPPAQAID
jgi:protein O-mannosyl-transferase